MLIKKNDLALFLDYNHFFQLRWYCLLYVLKIHREKYNDHSIFLPMTMRKRDGKMEKMSGKMTDEKMAMMTAMNSNDLLVSNSIVYKIYRDEIV